MVDAQGRSPRFDSSTHRSARSPLEAAFTGPIVGAETELSTATLAARAEVLDALLSGLLDEAPSPAARELWAGPAGPFDEADTEIDPPCSRSSSSRPDEDPSGPLPGGVQAGLRRLDRVAPRAALDSLAIQVEQDGRLVGWAVLRRGGEAYILGHPAPGGTAAPASDHPGLRLVRLHADRSADLVLPWDARGEIVRGGLRIPLTDLLANRRYTAIYLEPGDRALVVLGLGRNAVLYRISASGGRPSRRAWGSGGWPKPA